MTGGSGNDVFYVDDLGDKTFEGVAGGIDRVLSTLTHTLAINIEELTLSGTTAANATGTANTIPCAATMPRTRSTALRATTP